MAAFTILTIVQGFVDREGGWSPALIAVLLAVTVVAVLVNSREWVRVTESEVQVQTSFARLRRLPRKDVSEIRAGRRLVQLIAADGSAFVTIDRGVYSDSQLLEMAETIQIAVRGPRRPRRLGLFEGTQPPHRGNPPG